MKKMLKLNELNKDEMTMINGGTTACGCSCNGPSGSNSNGSANSAGGKTSPGWKLSDGIWVTA